jgi:hypothetical protein
LLPCTAVRTLYAIHKVVSRWIIYPPNWRILCSVSVPNSTFGSWNCSFMVVAISEIMFASLGLLSLHVSYSVTNVSEIYI